MDNIFQRQFTKLFVIGKEKRKKKKKQLREREKGEKIIFSLATFTFIHTSLHFRNSREECFPTKNKAYTSLREIFAVCDVTQSS